MAGELKALLVSAAKLGVTISGLPSFRKALPKTKLGGLVDEYHDLREVRLAVGKVAEALQAEEQRILNHIIDTVDADTEAGAVGKRYKGVIKRELVPVVEDWEKFHAYIKKTGSFDLLNKAINRAAAKERLEAGKAIPGVDTMQAKKLSVTKV